MNENKFTEKDSLELISQMIQQTKQNLQVGSGNILLYYGYLATFISVIVYGLCEYTNNMHWHYLWFIMFIIMPIHSKSKPHVVTYIDKAISSVWKVISLLFILTVLTNIGLGLLIGCMPFTLMMPLSLLYVGIGTSITGVITKDKSMIYTPALCFILSIYMLGVLATGGHPTLLWNLLGGLSFFTMLVIPGHILNNKISKSCSKN